jgi:hypothetical protein
MSPALFLEPVMPRSPRRDTRVRNRLFWITVTAAVVAGLWLAR